MQYNTNRYLPSKSATETPEQNSKYVLSPKTNRTTYQSQKPSLILHLTTFSS